MPLTSARLKSAKPQPKQYKLYDDKGLYLLVHSSGGKYWRLKYRFNGKEKTLALGVYPEVSLAEARDKRDEARKLKAQGIDPSAHKKAMKTAVNAENTNSFEVVAREWLDKRGPKSIGGDKRLFRLLEKDLCPFIGNRPVADIKPGEVLQALRKVESRGALDTARRARQAAAMVFRYAVATGRADRDPTADLKGALATPTKKHFATITEPTEVGKLVKAIDGYSGTPVVEAALKLSPLLFCRPGELRHLEWAEVDGRKKQIELPSSKTKTKQPHIIPLSTQALKVIEDLRPLTGKGKYVFPSARGKGRPLSENGVRTALRTLGYDNTQISPHGFRALARTLLDEELGFRVDWIEHQLGHAVKDPNGRAYNRTKYLNDRKRMMQEWSDYLDNLSENSTPN